MPRLAQFLIRDGLYNQNCICVNYTSTEARLAPGIDPLYSINSWPGVHKEHAVVQFDLSHNKGPQNLHEGPDSCSISCACSLKILALKFIHLQF